MFKGSVLAIIGIFILFSFVGITSYVSGANYANEAEVGLTAKLNNNKNILGQYSLKVGEMAQVPDIYRADLEKVIQATFEGRYGADGSKATWQWIQEQNPNLDPALYNRLQQTMEAGRNEFTVSQTELLDQKRAYETNLGYLWRGFWIRLAGYPKISLADIKIVVASDTQQQFDSGVDEGIQLRKPADAK